MPHFDEEKQRKQVADFREREEEDLAILLAGRYGVPYADLSVTSIEPEALRLMPEHEARRALVAPFRISGKKVLLAVHSPKNPQTGFAIADLEARGYEMALSMVSMKSLERAWARYADLSYASQERAGIFEISSDDILNFAERIHSLTDIQTLIGEVGGGVEKAGQTSKILEITLAGAIGIDASDIHIEPEETKTRLRIRLDGVLHDVSFFSDKVYRLLASRVKLVSGMKLNITNAAQDGRFSIVFGKEEIDIRASAIPGAYGESLVLRLLNPKSINVPFEKLGIDFLLQGVIDRELEKPNGMILTTGPTGSGKTTSLYSFLKKIYTPESKIITIENPIEYHIEGLVQTQTNEKDYTFYTGLRAALRQDPDVIMIGEIRDSETAKTAVDAAITGHLVFSTLHTNNAAASIPRLIGLGVNPKIIASAVNLVMAQRLVRVLCSVCKEERVQTPEEKRVLDEILGGIVGRGVENSGKIFEAPGCEACNGTGFRGQVGIYEGILMDKAVESILDQNPSDREVKKTARPQGLLDMREDGAIKIVSGMTTLAELSRVIDIAGER